MVSWLVKGVPLVSLISVAGYESLRQRCCSDNIAGTCEPPPTHSWHVHVLFNGTQPIATREATRFHREFSMRFSVHENCPDGADNGEPMASRRIPCALPTKLEASGPFATAQLGFYLPLSTFSNALSWVTQKRGSLEVLVHPNTGCPVQDHVEWPLWFGAEPGFVVRPDGSLLAHAPRTRILDVVWLNEMANNVYWRRLEQKETNKKKEKEETASTEDVGAENEATESDSGESKIEEPKSDDEGEKMAKETEELEEVPCLFDVEMAVSVMLLGGMVFIMTLFYLVNLEDVDLKRCAWEVISACISIFVVLLLFEGVNGIIDHFIVEYMQASEVVRAVLGYGVFLIFYAGMSITIGFLAAHKCCNREPDYDNEIEENVDMQLRMECWVTLWSHAAGFAAIDAIGHVQHLEAVAGSPALVFMAILFHGLFLLGLFRLMDWIRSKMVHYVHADEDVAERWEAASEEAENDAGALTLSFALVQWVRFVLSGSLPEIRGEDVGQLPKFVHYMGYGAGLLFVVLSFLSVAGIHICDKEYGEDDGQASQLALAEGESSSQARKAVVEQELEHDAHIGFDPLIVYIKRWRFIITNTWAMSFAWCVLFSSKGLMGYAPPVMDLPDSSISVMREVILALVCCAVASSIVFAIDKIADRLNEHSLNTAHEEDAGMAQGLGKAFRFIMSAQGVLVGFSWELAFEVSVERIVEHAAEDSRVDPMYLKFAIGIAVALIVIPAWRMYILRSVLEATKECYDLGKPLADPDVIHHFAGKGSIITVLEAPTLSGPRRQISQESARRVRKTPIPSYQSDF